MNDKRKKNSVSDGELAREQFIVTAGADDEGNALSMLRMYPDKFIANPHQFPEGWAVYDGQKWRLHGAVSELERCIVKMIEYRSDLAKKARKKAREEDKPELENYYENLVNFLKRTKARVGGCKALLSSHIHGDLDQFDRDKNGLNCNNGWVDLRTGKLHPHDAAKMFTYCIPIDYKPEASYQQWEEWLFSTLKPETGDQTDEQVFEMLEYLKMACGYSLTGHTNEECLFYLYGETRAGKGTFTETILKLINPPLSEEVDFKSFTAKRDNDANNFDLAGLKAARIIFASESNKYQRLNSARIKTVTGGNAIRCAFKGKDNFNYFPQFKTWLSSNFPINGDPTDKALWGRVKVVEFPNSYLGREDKSLKQRMLSEANLQGVFLWMVEGAKGWYDSPRGLVTPEPIEAKTEEHRYTNDYIAHFLEEYTVNDPDKFVVQPHLYAKYRDWCNEQDINPMSSPWFSKEIAKLEDYDLGRKTVDVYDAKTDREVRKQMKIIVGLDWKG